MAELELNTGGCLGCIGTVVAIIVLWALIFGVTIGGQHYGLNCSCNDGVEVEGLDG